MERGRLRIVCTESQAKGLLKMVNSLPDNIFHNLENKYLLIQYEDEVNGCGVYPDNCDSIDLGLVNRPEDAKAIGSQWVQRTADGVDALCFSFSGGIYHIYSKRPKERIV